MDGSAHNFSKASTTAVKSKRYSRALSVWFISIRDLMHEPLLTSCLILSIVAVLVPLMLLLSVKVGFVERLRSDLIADPVFREIHPSAADIRQNDELETYRHLAGVRYLVPSVMLVPREVTMLVRRGEKTERTQLKLVPTSNSDPLHKKVIGRFDPADPDALIITGDIAEKYSLNAGDEVELAVSRIENRRTRRVKIRGRITGILPEELLPLPSILASSALDRAVENYRAGISVPARGWPGVQQAPKQAYEAMLIAAPRALDEVDRREIILTVGAVSFKRVAGPQSGFAPLLEALGLPAEYANHPLFSVREGISHVYMMRNNTPDETVRRYYSADDLAEATEYSARFAGFAYGFNRKRPFEIADAKVNGISANPMLFTGMRSLYYPWRFGRNAKLEPNLEIYPSNAFKNKISRSTPESEPSENIKIYFDDNSKTGHHIELPVRIERFLPLSDQIALVSPIFIAMLERGQQIPLAYDPANRMLVEQATGYRGFRLVAQTLADVPKLVEKFTALSVKVRSKSGAIIKLQRLNRSLNFLVFAIGTVALIGGVCVVAASCIANVKRKAVDYATFRLIGVSKAQIFQIPVIQSILVAIIAMIVSILAYAALSAGINAYIAQLVNFDGQLSRLDTAHFIYLTGVVVVGAAAASLAAARDATAIDPSLALGKV